MNPLAFAFAITAALCWGTAQVLGKLALRDLSSLNFNAIRFSFVATVIVPIAILSDSLERCEIKLILLAIVVGVLSGFIATQLFFYSMKRSSAHRIIPVGNSFPLWVIILAPLLLNEVVKPILPVSAVLVLGGTFLLVSAKNKSEEWRAGILLAMIVAFFWGLKDILLRFILELGMEPFTLLTISVISATVLFDLTAWIRRFRSRSEFNKRSVGLSLTSGAFAFIFGEFFLLSALKIERASALAPIFATVILFGFLLSIILARERPTWRAILGMGLTFLGVFLTTL